MRAVKTTGDGGGDLSESVVVVVGEKDEAHEREGIWYLLCV
jgi:hypothetical protein